jgi:cyclopropane fatty-acyl-phospholipid synthase-like methyltransferase
MTAQWFETLDDSCWLPPDDTGAKDAAFIRKALRLRKGQSVLDAPCGAGRVSFHLAQAGCRVTGVDLRKQFIARARRRFRKAGLKAQLITGDLREIDFQEEFHGIFNWWGSFGYFDDSENTEVLRRFVAALRSGGRLLVDQVNRERILRNFIASSRTEKMATRTRWDAKRQRVITRRSIKGSKNRPNISDMRLYTSSQMTRLFERAGLRVEAVYGSHKGEPYHRGTRRMSVVGVKE